MKLTSRGRSAAGGLQLSLTSMIDVVFLLLIFFLTTTTFVQPRKSLETTLSTREAIDSDRAAELEPAVIRLSRAGDQTLFRLGAVSTADPVRIEAMLQGFSNKSPGAFVEVSAGVPFGDAARMIAICRKTGFSPVTWLAGESGNLPDPASSREPP